MPVQSELFERPASLHSGPALEQKVAVYHRSDLLLQEQKDNVQNMQESLQRALLELEHSSNTDEIGVYERQAKELREKCSQMLLVLKIAHKINSELSYARAELQKALKHGGDINSARKRVNWLEDRIERVLGRKKDRPMRKLKAKGKKEAKEEEEVVESILSDLELSDITKSLLPAEVIAGLASDIWSDRLTATEKFLEILRGKSKEDIPCQACVRILAKKPGLKEMNCQVWKHKMVLLSYLALNSSFTKTSATYCMRELVDNIGDYRNGDAVKEALSCIAEACTLQYVSMEVLRLAFEQKNPQNVADTFNWLSVAVKEFGLRIETKTLIEYVKQGFASSNQAVRTSVLLLVGVLYLYMGPEVKEAFADEQPATQRQISYEIERAKDMKPPLPSRGRRFEEDVAARAETEDKEEEVAEEDRSHVPADESTSLATQSAEGTSLTVQFDESTSLAAQADESTSLAAIRIADGAGDRLLDAEDRDRAITAEKRPGQEELMGQALAMVTEDSSISAAKKHRKGKEKRIKKIDKVCAVAGKKETKSDQEEATSEDKQSATEPESLHYEEAVEPSVLQAAAGDIRIVDAVEAGTQDAAFTAEDATALEHESKVKERPESASSASSISYTSGSSDAESEESEDEKERLMAKLGQGQTFLTETSILSTKSQKSRGSHVTIKTPAEYEEYLQQKSLRKLSDASEQDGGTTCRHSEQDVSPECWNSEEDASTEYWNSEHHRFTYSEHQAALLNLNPLSYHQMGLALPGTFVKPPCGRSTKLPWRPTDSKREVSDVHKDALDKLSVKVNKMYRKVNDAAMLSVKPSEQEEEISAKFMQNIDLGRETPLSNSSKPAMNGQGQAKSGGKAVTALPPLDKERPGSSTSGRLVFHPKPLPQPAKLPVPKTSRSKEYPPPSDTFSNSQAGRDPPAQRLVDQRNLMQETKFSSSLYRSKPKAGRQTQQSSDERERLLLQKDSRQEPIKGLRPAFTMVRAAGAFQGSKWNEIKPCSGALQHSGLKWERVKGLVHSNLISPSPAERANAAHELGVLGCDDTMVMYALRERLQDDSEERVVYEAAKALIKLGSWQENVLDVLIYYLVNGNQSIREDIVNTIREGKNVQFVNKKLQAFPELAKVLRRLCLNMDPMDKVSFTAAVCLGKMCVADETATKKLHSVLQKDADTHTKAQALDVLIKQMHQHHWDIVCAVMDQLVKSPVWGYRKEAAKLIIHLGSKHVLTPPHVDWVFEILQRRLWQDPMKQVRLQVAKSLAVLGLYPSVCLKVANNLEDPSEETRAQAVISVGTLGMKNERMLRQLLEMLELDASEYVRAMVMRSFVQLGSTDKRVIRALQDKARADGALGREAKKTLASLGAPVSIQQTTAKQAIKTK